MLAKPTRWIKRYLPAETVATLCAIFCAAGTYSVTRNEILAAFAGTWGENVGFYGVMAMRDIRSSKEDHKTQGRPYTLFSLFANIRSLTLEFGPAEILDGFVIRPFSMYLFPVLIGNFALGVFAGKVAADIVFYVPTIISYEVQQMSKQN